MTDDADDQGARNGFVKIPAEFWQTHTLTLDGHARLTDEALSAEMERVARYAVGLYPIDALAILGCAVENILAAGWPPDQRLETAQCWVDRLLESLQTGLSKPPTGNAPQAARGGKRR